MVCLRSQILLEIYLEKWKLNEYVNIDYMFSECDKMKNKPSWYKE